MSTTPATPAEVFALVQSSPALVAAHDKAGWLGIFGEPFIVEDPVGAPSVRSEQPGALAAFWDAFIAPNDIEFRVAHDWIDGLDVVRDVTIVTTMPSGVQVSTPAHLIYHTEVQGGVLKVRRMAAHWETAPAARQLMRLKRSYVGAGVRQATHLIRTLGWSHAVKFFGAQSIGKRGKKVVVAHLAEQGITEVHKMIASGRCVTASISLNGQPAGVIAQFEPKSLTIVDFRIYSEPV